MPLSGGWIKLHQRRAGAIDAAGKFLADGNGDIPELVADEVEPHRERGDDPAKDDVGDNGPDQLADAHAALARPHDDGRREDEKADEPQLLAQVFDHRLKIGNEIADGHVRTWKCR